MILLSSCIEGGGKSGKNKSSSDIKSGSSLGNNQNYYVPGTPTINSSLNYRGIKYQIHELVNFQGYVSGAVIDLPLVGSSGSHCLTWILSQSDEISLVNSRLSAQVGGKTIRLENHCLYKVNFNNGNYCEYLPTNSFLVANKVPVLECHDSYGDFVVDLQVEANEYIWDHFSGSPSEWVSSCHEPLVDFSSCPPDSANRNAVRFILDSLNESVAEYEATEVYTESSLFLYALRIYNNEDSYGYKDFYTEFFNNISDEVRNLYNIYAGQSVGTVEFGLIRDFFINTFPSKNELVSYIKLIKENRKNTCDLISPQLCNGPTGSGAIGLLSPNCNEAGEFTGFGNNCVLSGCSKVGFILNENNICVSSHGSGNSVNTLEEFNNAVESFINEWTISFSNKNAIVSHYEKVLLVKGYTVTLYQFKNDMLQEIVSDVASNDPIKNVTITSGARSFLLREFANAHSSILATYNPIATLDDFAAIKSQLESLIVEGYAQSVISEKIRTVYIPPEYEEPIVILPPEDPITACTPGSNEVHARACTTLEYSDPHYLAGSVIQVCSSEGEWIDPTVKECMISRCKSGWIPNDSRTACIEYETDPENPVCYFGNFASDPKYAVYEGDNKNLTTSSPWKHSLVNDPNVKCEFRCSANFGWVEQESSCTRCAHSKHQGDDVCFYKDFVGKIPDSEWISGINISQEDINNRYIEFGKPNDAPQIKVETLETDGESGFGFEGQDTPNTFQQAKQNSITAFNLGNEEKNITIAGSTGFNNDHNDYFKINISEPGTFSVSITGNLMDVDLRIYNENGEQLQGSFNWWSESEAIELTIRNEQNIYVRIDPFEYATQATEYKLNIHYIPGVSEEERTDKINGVAVTGNDMPNDMSDTKFNLATKISSGSAAITGSVGHREDGFDYYRFVVVEPGATISVSMTPVDANLDIGIYDASEGMNKDIITSENTGLATESISGEFLNAGTYFLKVFPADEQFSIYSMEFRLSTEDQTSDNDTAAIATCSHGELGGGNPDTILNIVKNDVGDTFSNACSINNIENDITFSGGVGFGSSDPADYYRFSTNKNGDLKFTMDYSDVSGATPIFEVLNSNGTVINTVDGNRYNTGTNNQIYGTYKIYDNTNLILHIIPGGNQTNPDDANYTIRTEFTASLIQEGQNPYPSTCSLTYSHQDYGGADFKDMVLDMSTGGYVSFKFRSEITGDDSMRFKAMCRSTTSEIDAYLSQCKFGFGWADRTDPTNTTEHASPSTYQFEVPFSQNGSFETIDMPRNGVNGDDSFYYRIRCPNGSDSRLNTYMKNDCQFCMGFSYDGEVYPNNPSCKYIQNNDDESWGRIMTTQRIVNGNDRLYIGFFCGEPQDESNVKQDFSGDF